MSRDTNQEFFLCQEANQEFFSSPHGWISEGSKLTGHSYTGILLYPKRSPKAYKKKKEP